MPKFNVSFYSYSLIGMLDDVEVIIFDEVNYKPWNETKYKKRIYRVLILNFLMYFNKYDGMHYKNKLMVMKNIIFKIKNNKFNLKIKNTELKRLQTKLKKVYQKKEDNPKKFNEYKKTLLEILQKLYKVFLNQYILTRNPILNINKGNISSRTLR